MFRVALSLFSMSRRVEGLGYIFGAPSGGERSIGSVQLQLIEGPRTRGVYNIAPSHQERDLRSQELPTKPRKRCSLRSDLTPPPYIVEHSQKHPSCTMSAETLKAAT